MRNGSGTKDKQDVKSNGFLPNTNLEEVSDWLTKIILGATLTQLTSIAGAVNRASDAVGTVFGGGDAGRTIGGVVLIYFSISGFFTGYLVTYLFLTREFRDLYDDIAYADADAILEKLPDDRKKKARERLKESSTRATTTDELRRVEAVMVASLYDDPPEGFTRTIDAALAYLKDPKRPQSASLHAWLACAYGQNYRWSLGHQAKPEGLRAMRDLALRATRTAVELDADWKDVLAGTLTRDAGDNDLRAFKDDPEFKALLLQ